MAKGRARKVKRRMAELLELPQEIDLATPRMTMVGRSELLIENLRDILSVSETKIRIDTAIGTVCIEGETLVMGEFSNERAFIRGKIASWHFEDAF